MFAGQLSNELESAPRGPDYFSALTTAELQKILKDTPTLPLEQLLNRGGTRIDYEGRRIWRDCFWKGTFARDNLLGWEECVASAKDGDSGRFTGGRFWKRFTTINGDCLQGYVVNYNLRFLPGKPVVRTVIYPDCKRAFIAQGDEILLLTYLNAPYHFVYDLIKVIDPNNVIGVMHLGRFPSGIEFATWVGARNNFPLENMSVLDHDAIFSSRDVRVPTEREVEGLWQGYKVWVKSPDDSLHNQFNLQTFRVEFKVSAGLLSAHFRFAKLWESHRSVSIEPGFLRVSGSLRQHHQVRIIDGNTLIGRRCDSSDESRITKRYVLKRLAR
jgi:hypothetical protein